MRRSTLLMAVVTLAATFVSASAKAQSYLDATAKARGAYGRSSASRSMGNARAYTQDYRQYAKGVQKVDPEVAQDASDSIGNYITKAKKHFAWMRDQAKKANDKESLAALDEIDKNLAAAEEAHHEMHDICKKDHVDAAGSMKCCQQIDESLAKAIADHDKLMKRLGLAVPAATGKK